MTENEKFAEWLKEYRKLLQDEGFKSTAKSKTLLTMFTRGASAESAVLDMIGFGLIKELGE